MTKVTMTVQKPYHRKVTSYVKWHVDFGGNLHKILVEMVRQGVEPFRSRVQLNMPMFIDRCKALGILRDEGVTRDKKDRVVRLLLRYPTGAAKGLSFDAIYRQYIMVVPAVDHVTGVINKRKANPATSRNPKGVHAGNARLG